jgi:hypothetical protein
MLQNAPRLNISAFDLADENEHNGHHQKDVDKAAYGIRRHKSQKPQDNEDQRDCV